MAYQLKTEAEIEDLGTVAYVEAPFDKALQTLTQNGYTLISARDLAYARIQINNPKHSLSQYGSYMKEGVTYIPENSSILLVRNSPLLQLELAEEAVQSNRNGKEYSIDQKLAKEYQDKVSEDMNSEVFPLTERCHPNKHI